MKKRVIGIFVLTCVMCLLLPGCQAAADGGRIANESRSGVVRVETYYEGGMICFLDSRSGSLNQNLSYDNIYYYAWGSGTGFGIGTPGRETDTFATNRHVVDDVFIDEMSWNDVLNEISSRFGSGAANQYAAYQGQYEPILIMERVEVFILLDDLAFQDGEFDESHAVQCEVVYRGSDTEPDLAVLQTLDGRPVSGREALPLLPAAGDRDVQSGDKVYALGYPGSTDDVNGTTAASVERVTVTDGIVSLHTQYIDGNGVEADAIQHTAQINHGNSGGPLLDARGAVIAVNTWINGQDLATGDRMNSYSIEVKYLRELLDDLGIRYGVYSEKSGSISIEMIGAAAAAAVVIAVAAMAMTRKSRAAAAAPARFGQPGQFAQPQAPGQVGQPGQPQAAPVQAAPAQASPVIAGDTGLRIQGVAGQFAGRRFAIAGQLRIGRDPSRNDLVYPADSQGVSGVHCVLVADGGRLLLQDLGSTYGTFVGGSRLAANAPVEMRAGDRFCLGSERETFVVARKGEV